MIALPAPVFLANFTRVYQPPLHDQLPNLLYLGTHASLVSHAGNLEGGIERLDYLLNYIQTANEVSIPGSQECDCVAVFNLGVFSATGGQIQGLPLANRITVSVC